METESPSADLAHAYNPLAPPQLADPYPVYARARAEAPVFYSPRFNFWIVTRYDDIVAVLKDPRRFSSRQSIRFAPRDPAARTLIEESGAQAGSLVSDDPPDHTWMRSLVSQAFTPRRVAALEPRVREIAAELIDGFAADGSADLVARFTQPLPMIVIGELLGIPRADLPTLKRWTTDQIMLLAGRLPPDAELPAAQSFVAFQRYVQDLLDARRREPRDDLLTALLDARADGETRLSDPQVISLCKLVIMAGHETTTHLLGHALALLLRHPDQWQAARDDPAQLENAVEEAMRMEGPATGVLRLTTEPVELGGVAIPPGALVYVVLAAGNRDDRQFPHADTFDIGRDGAQRHLGFGWGIHFCLGAPLARLEARVALQTLGRRLPGLRFGSDEPIPYLPNLLLRGPQQLLVAWDPPGA